MKYKRKRESKFRKDDYFVIRKIVQWDSIKEMRQTRKNNFTDGILQLNIIVRIETASMSECFINSLNATRTMENIAQFIYFLCFLTISKCLT